MITIKEKEERKNTIGASEVHKLYNFDTETCQNLWEEKIGLINLQELDNDDIDAGNILEEDCLDYYENKINEKLIRNERVEHSKIKNFIVSLDARKELSNVPVENKVVGEEVFNNWKAKRVFNATCVNDEEKYNVPSNYYLQVQSQISVLKSDYGTLLVNTLTYEEKIDPFNVEITDLHQKELVISKSQEVIDEIEKRVIYFLDCLKYKKRPGENEYLEKNLY